MKPESHLQMPVGGVLDLILRVHPRIACYFDPCSRERAQTALMLGCGLALSTALVTNANCSVLCTSPSPLVCCTQPGFPSGQFVD